MYKFHYGNNSRLLFTDTDSLKHEIKTEDAYEGFRNDKEMFDFSNYSSKSKYYDNSNKLVGLKPKMYSYLVDDNSENKKAKCVNRNAVATISHSNNKDVFLNKKCFEIFDE